MNLKFKVLINASSGGGKGRKVFPTIKDKLKAMGITGDCALSQSSDEALALALEAREQGYDFLVAGGGDGTIHRLLPAVAQNSMGLGVIPLGTANDLARSWGIPPKLDAALRVLIQGRPRLMDILVTDKGEYIAGAAGIGFDVAVVERGEQFRKCWRKGVFPFLLATWIEFFRYRLPELSVEGNGWRFEGLAWQAIFTKIPRYALLLKVLPSTKRDDGLMTVCLVPRIAKSKVFFLFPFFLLFGLKIIRSAHYYSGSTVRVESSRSLPIHGDGEVIGHTPVTFRVIPQALRVLGPPQNDEGMRGKGRL